MGKYGAEAELAKEKAILVHLVAIIEGVLPHSGPGGSMRPDDVRMGMGALAICLREIISAGVKSEHVVGLYDECTGHHRKVLVERHGEPKAPEEAAGESEASQSGEHK